MNIAIIGCGAIAKTRHAPAVAVNPDAVLYAVCDQTRANADALAEQYGARAFYDVNEAITDPAVDAVIICTPERFHCTHVVAALEAGKDVLCEKPLAMTPQEGAQILDAWHKSGRRLMVAFAQRLTAEHQLGKKHACLFPPFFCQKILHIRRQSPDHMHSQIKAIGFYEFVGRYIVKMFGRGNLSGNLSRKVHSICPKEFQKTMQLIRHQERVYRVTKENDFCLRQSFPRGGKVFLITFDPLPDGKLQKLMLWMQHLKVSYGLQCGASFSFRASIENKNFHNVFSNFW